MMKKTLLALAVTALSANAFAVNLDTPSTPGTQVFASEIDVTAPVVLGAVAGPSNLLASLLKTEGGLGFALTNSYVRYELSNGATFDTAVVAADLTSPTYAGAKTVAGGGTVGSNYVIFNLGGAALATDKLVFQHSAKVTSQSAVTVSYSLHQQASDAVNKTNALSTKTGTLLSFSKGLVSTSAANTPLEIDAIAQAGKKFVGAATKTPMITLNLAAATPAVARIDGSPAELADLVNLTGTKWTVTGNFSAAKSIAGGDLDTGAAGYKLATDKQSATKTTVVAAETVSYEVNGTDAIAETAIAATLTPVAASGMKVAPVTISDITRLKNNGKTAKAAFVLKPNGAYKNFVRVSNTGSVATLFTITVTNDAGKSTTINMADVAGQSATAIPAGGSSPQMSIVDIYNAAVAKDFALAGDGKLRLSVTGATTGVSLQNYVTSIDGNVLSVTSIEANDND